MLPEPATGIYESALPTSSHGINETESENLVYIALETKSDNDEIAGEKMSFSSSASCAQLGNHSTRHRTWNYTH